MFQRTREAAAVDGSPTERTHAANQQTQLLDGTTLHTFTYDGAGNQLQARVGALWTTSRTWDDENRPTRDETKVSILPATVTSLTYDGSGLLVRRQQGTSESKLVWDNQNLLLETDGANATQVMYTLEPLGFGNLVSMRRLVGGNWTRRYYHFNNIGTTDRLTDETQTVTDRYQLDPWGKTLLAATGTTVNPFRYIGKLGYYLYSTSSVTDAYYVRARHYQPLYWRWWSRDPVRELIKSLYRYSSCRPSRLSDPTGRQPGDPLEGTPCDTLGATFGKSWEFVPPEYTTSVVKPVPCALPDGSPGTKLCEYLLVYHVFYVVTLVCEQVGPSLRWVAHANFEEDLAGTIEIRCSECFPQCFYPD